MVENNSPENDKSLTPMSYLWNHSGFNTRRYAPWYSDKADYNTNAKSYYDYLARFSAYLEFLEEVSNRLLARNIEVSDTNTIDFNKVGDWINNGNCPPDNYDDIEHLSANVKISGKTVTITLGNLQPTTYTLKNAISAKDDGIYSADFTEVIQAINSKIGDLQNQINDINNKIGDIINHLPTGDLEFTSKEVMWESTSGGAMSGTATKDFTPGTYEIEWGADALGFTTGITIVTVQGNKNITYTAYNNSDNLTQGVYNCNIMVNASNKRGWTAQIGVIESIGAGANTSRTPSNPKVGKISRLSTFKFSFD